MRLLILGGTQFLGRAIASRACALGHDVTCAARGVDRSGSAWRALHPCRPRRAGRSCAACGRGVRRRRRCVASSRPGAPRRRGTQGRAPRTGPCVDGERLRRQPHDRAAGRHRAAPRAHGAGDRAQHRGNLWRRQGRVRAGDGRERLHLQGRPDRRSGGPDGAVHLLAGPARSRRRGAGGGDAGRAAGFSRDRARRARVPRRLRRASTDRDAYARPQASMADSRSARCIAAKRRIHLHRKI